MKNQMNKIYVYDRNKYFYCMLKRIFVKKCVIEKISKISNIKDLKSDDFLIFVAYDLKELNTLYVYLKASNIRLLICTDTIKSSDNHHLFSIFRRIDISSPKSFFLNELKLAVNEYFEIK